MSCKPLCQKYNLKANHNKFNANIFEAVAVNHYARDSIFNRKVTNWPMVTYSKICICKK